MFSYEEHLDNLLRHLELVRGATTLLGKRLIAQGRSELGRIVIAKGQVHDASKWTGIEWDYLHAGNDVPRGALEFAIRNHRLTNTHHPEYWGGIEFMPEQAIAEMVCDWYARAQEFGTGLREWVEKRVENIDVECPEVVGKIHEFMNILLRDSFVRKES